MHAHHPHQRPGRGGERIWLIAGTGEGPALAAALLERGWRLRVSLVAAQAARAYSPHPLLELAIGAIGVATADPGAGVRAELETAAGAGDPFRWVVDASHPFATAITPALAAVCLEYRQPLLRLRRPPQRGGVVISLAGLEQLNALVEPGRRLLLAIGTRRLSEAISHCPGARHHARILPSADGLRLAMAAGMAPERVACLRPSAAGCAVERALCRRWRIETLLARASGGSTEAHWRAISAELDLELLLLRRPSEPEGIEALPYAALLAKLGTPMPEDAACPTP
ncbi:MAG: precorrin-6A/cobalt-precorrin-6A reductase [Synechococcaceae cyanobacterium]|nr:precorrin-6A/cobalt-precorrin-6A reductase [Synechococcaceae cyanobacterium]